jgi:hypothetical protein
MLHFDFHVEWSNRPDLWNWFDPKKPGYSPDNWRNVEWFGWDGPPARARYLNWGEVQRMPPSKCFTSKAVRAEWTRLIRDVIFLQRREASGETDLGGSASDANPAQDGDTTGGFFADQSRR